MELKPDNVLFDEGNATQTIQELLVRSLQIVDTQWTNRKPPTRTISAYALRAPEVILGANYHTKDDICAPGRMVSYHVSNALLTGRWLFNPQGGQTWCIEDLAKIAELMGKDSSEKILARSRKRDEYFDESGRCTSPRGVHFISVEHSLLISVSGKLLRIDQLFPMTLESAMMKYGLTEAAAFNHACLYFPDERSSASDLLGHPWLESTYTCSIENVQNWLFDPSRIENSPTMSDCSKEEVCGFIEQSDVTVVREECQRSSLRHY
ncbi:hypothetical protein DFJ58DRAFT_732469 [Suillus subalutaceus]|uniref:uncharacterized protein n=1 Tax=Suillus subalutaceus TaxID=48586 RepID=UPI001B882A06|nr:uncharacterized protein DFJ58DRAFT_732469 [Suillus subalutaceus]KAG1841293.1 hypothetical protein DFJ58DRAFT_732469 [Suillus subalutaceus]